MKYTTERNCQRTQQTATEKRESAVSTDKTQLLENLNTILPDLDADGLTFLLQQAHILHKHGLKHTTTISQHSHRKSDRDSQDTQTPSIGSDKYSMHIKEKEDTGTFTFVINGENKFFTRAEMKKMVKLCHRSSDEKEATRMLYRFFKEERGDVLFTVGIDNAADPALSTIYTNIISTYTVKS